MTEEDPDAFVVHISSREIYDKLVAVDEGVKDLSHTDRRILETMADHEARMRTLERWKYGIPVATISAIFAVVASVKGN